MCANKIDAWIEARKQEDDPLRLTNTEAEAWRQFLNAPASEVAHHAKQIALPNIRPIQDDDCRLHELWNALAEAVNDFTDQNDKLAQFVVELHRLPDGKGIAGAWPFFEPLPEFDIFWTEWIQFQFDHSQLDESDPEHQKNRQAHINQHTFLAKITAQGAPDKATGGNWNPVLDQRERGGLAFTWALERTPWDEESPSYDPNGFRINALDVHVLAAAPWLAYCAEGMYEKALAGGRKSWEYPGTLSNWGVMGGWSKERWDFWRKRFPELSNMSELKEETRTVAKECAERMAEAEKSRS
ncbi:uncharacterized protein F4822DRAFT_244790 [Hypoxylon trugodes]|uniref:uncharacterized protein n=1 Tax=Hypoxylon trugodes TaxID=326681 RepID=UPI00218DBB16|nr:uncharacterized protein F4822DRAFT_244790 [Hypoxylon trugodes]KAI1388389.1 hypothetical protein F4822DRAFT_244790 [Hypoxylon trugodes]